MLLLLLLIDPLLLLLLLLLLIRRIMKTMTNWQSMDTNQPIGNQFFAVSPSNAKRIGVPPLLRTELALFLFVHSQACGIGHS